MDTRGHHASTKIIGFFCFFPLGCYSYYYAITEIFDAFARRYIIFINTRHASCLGYIILKVCEQDSAVASRLEGSQTCH